MSQSADDGVSEELLDEALAESFPASDPLSFWSGPDDAGDGPQTGQVDAAGESPEDAAGQK